MTRRPSFVLFVTDQHRADYLGCAGHPQLRTPEIDAIARAGVMFDRFYVASPVCMPNRASLMTCRMPASHGVRCNGLPLNRRHVTFVERLREAGYATALIGKSHLQTFSGLPGLLAPPEGRAGYHGAGAPLPSAVRHDLFDADYQLEERSFWAEPEAALPLPFYGFDHVDLVTSHGDNPGGAYGRWLRVQRPDADQLVGRDNQLPHDYTLAQAVRTAVPETLYATRYIAERAAAWAAAQEGRDQPFFLMVSWPDPHHPFNPPGRFWDMYAPEDMAVPEAFTRPDWTPPPQVAGTLQAREAGRANLYGMASIGCTAREAQEARALTCGMIAMIDAGVGQVRGALSASGRAEEAVQIFTSDHGDHLGDHRMLYKGAAQYDPITRVPFIWADPQGPSGTRSDQFGQTHDIGATILERARVEPAYGMTGRDLFGGGAAGCGVYPLYPPKADGWAGGAAQRGNAAAG
jgi:arylsulfatase A-like enzyme